MAVWVNESPDGTFGEFGQTDLKPYLDAHERDIQDLAVITRTPRHYLFQSGQSPSGDAIQSAEQGLVAKAIAKMSDFSDPLEEAIRLARLFAGNKDNYVDSEVIWADPQTKDKKSNSDAIIGQYNAGLIDKGTALEELGYSPTQIERMESTAPAPQPVPAVPTEVLN